MINYTEILRSRQLSLTQGRIILLKILAETHFPLSGKEIEEKIKGKCDRATIYRNLNLFASRGVIQRVLAEDSVKFKLQAGKFTDNSQQDHVHFQCESCHKLFCLEDLHVRDFPLPEGFVKTENQFLIVGLCSNCNHEKKNS